MDHSEPNPFRPPGPPGHPAPHPSGRAVMSAIPEQYRCSTGRHIAQKSTALARFTSMWMDGTVSDDAMAALAAVVGEQIMDFGTNLLLARQHHLGLAGGAAPLAGVDAPLTGGVFPVVPEMVSTVEAGDVSSIVDEAQAMLDGIARIRGMTKGSGDEGADTGERTGERTGEGDGQ